MTQYQEKLRTPFRTDSRRAYERQKTPKNMTDNPRTMRHRRLLKDIRTQSSQRCDSLPSDCLPPYHPPPPQKKRGGKTPRAIVIFPRNSAPYVFFVFVGARNERKGREQTESYSCCHPSLPLRRQQRTSKTPAQKPGEYFPRSPRPSAARGTATVMAPVLGSSPSGLKTFVAAAA